MHRDFNEPDDEQYPISDKIDDPKNATVAGIIPYRLLNVQHPDHIVSMQGEAGPLKVWLGRERHGPIDDGYDYTLELRTVNNDSYEEGVPEEPVVTMKVAMGREELEALRGRINYLLDEGGKK